MEFGRVAHVEGTDFSLPPLDEASRRVLSGSVFGRGESRCRAFVGCPVWAEKAWVGSLYPPRTKAADYLYHYSRQFNAIELNSTHYGVPALETIEKWRDATPVSFRFCPKFPQAISHDQRLHNCGELTRHFVDAMRHLETRLGLSFLQLPPGFDMSELPRLERYLRELPRDFKIAVEFRHESWFEAGHLKPAAFATLERYDVGTVIADVGGRRDVVHASLPAPRVILRLLGNSLHTSDFTRANEWAERLSEWASLGLEEFYFFGHEPDNARDPELLGPVVDRLNELGGFGLERWTPYNLI